MIKYIPNLLSLVRVSIAICLLFLSPYQLLFWVLYLSCGLSDMVDGAIARRFKVQSDLGSKLDSFADFVFVFSLLLTLIRYHSMSVWLLTVILLVVIIKMTTLLIGYIKHRQFIVQHTVSNKVAGLTLFVYFPIYFHVAQPVVLLVTISLIAIYVSCQEAIVVIKGVEL
ncbi:CDP-diacylglycerol--glycerol-3-phosphate 3-phosphatidyltransferase [Amphibacillus marinus]|uniref:CDP-diacylglycerol--glycerol-3-phosphate 3-phosphatidyltransferase n=1 Tax=Amphibacillus marinus TaxID=872970 RepID=A0A1H8LEN6_9BACI|nr:CDP-alcohol phosphatidyltransferase family protein [Amphibacillus marinus]SEO03620.1 CDP-diacylglycerol--glycerol-3-phosphate 3-phosphatidyltransferase [Amphibacillus marinus]